MPHRGKIPPPWRSWTEREEHAAAQKAADGKAERERERQRHDARQDPRQVDWVSQFNQQFGEPN